MSGTYFSLEFLEKLYLNLSISDVIWVVTGAVIIALIGCRACLVLQSEKTKRAKMKEETERQKLKEETARHDTEVKAEILKTKMKEETAQAKIRERSNQAQEKKEALAIEAAKKEKDKGLLTRVWEDIMGK